MRHSEIRHFPGGKGRGDERGGGIELGGGNSMEEEERGKQIEGRKEERRRIMIRKG